MAYSNDLTCRFTLKSEDDLSLAVAFFSDNGGMNYGGKITVETPATAGPVVTNLWDDDGNVFFTIYLGDKGINGPNCVMNSASDPGTFDPYIQVAQENGLGCTIISNGGKDGEFDYILEVKIKN